VGALLGKTSRTTITKYMEELTAANILSYQKTEEKSTISMTILSGYCKGNNLHQIIQNIHYPSGENSIH
jgi:16S rRNA U1498 N3-methylase RsmE